MRHFLHHGGPCVQNHGIGMYPQNYWPGADDYARSASHKGNIDFALTRKLAFYVDRSCPNHGGGSGPLTQYCEQNTIAANDEIIATLLPNRSLFSEVWWEVIKPIAGITFDLVVLDTAGAVAYTLATGVDGGTADHGMIDVATVAGAPVYLHDNHMLAIVPTALPASGVKGWSVKVSPTLREFERGEH